MKQLLLVALFILIPDLAFADLVISNPPAAPDTTVSIGTLGAQLLGWVSAILLPVLGTFLTKWLMALAKKAGVQASQAMSDKLDDIITNGLHSGASTLAADLNGKLNVDVKSQVIAKAVAYAQSHAAETIKSMTGADPTDPKVIEALQARAAKALNDIGPAPVAPVAAPAAPVVAAAKPA